MEKTNRQSGQAIMEFMVLLLAFVVCFLGLLVVMGLSIANVEILSEAKFNAERAAQYVDYGGDGIFSDLDISTWEYTKYTEYEEHIDGDEKKIELSIPFLPKDKPASSQGNLNSFREEFNDPEDSEPGDKYEFNKFEVIRPAIANNFPNDAAGGGDSIYSASFKTANLLRGRSNEFDGENNALLVESKYFDRKKMYAAFELLLGIKEIEEIDLENNYSNTVFYPAMKVLEKGTD